MANKKEMVQLARLLVALGCTVETTNKNHVKITAPDKSRFCVIAGTPSDPRTFENSIRTIKLQIGLDLKPLMRDKKRLKQALKQAEGRG